MFYGIGAAVIGIIARSAFKLTKLTVGNDRVLWGIFAVLAISTAWTSKEIVWLFLLGGILNLMAKAWPTRLSERSITPLIFASPLLGAVNRPGQLLEIFVYFAKAGFFVFGSGLAVVPFLYGGVVQGHHWITEHQFVDAVAVAMITPGPVVITAGFVGYLVAGPLGALAAAAAVFAPPYFIVLFGAPYYRRFAQNRQVKAFVQGVTAAAVGAIAGAAYILARRSLVDTPTAIIAIVTLAVLMATKKVPEPVVILSAGVVGVLLHGTVG